MEDVNLCDRNNGSDEIESVPEWPIDEEFDIGQYMGEFSFAVNGESDDFYFDPGREIEFVTDQFHDSDAENAKIPDFEEVGGFDKIILGLGMLFKNRNVFKDALKEWCLKWGLNFVYKKNTSSKVTAVCEKGCGFRIHASQYMGSDTFQIKTWNPIHKCDNIFDKNLVNSTFIAKKFFNEIKSHTEWDISKMKERIESVLKVSVSRKQCLRARNKVRKQLEGDAKKQYIRLREYGERLIDANAGTKVIIKTSEDMSEWSRINVGSLGESSRMPKHIAYKFQYMYVRFSVQKQGYFSGIRPFVCLDGCFMKGEMGGHLLSAVARDGDDGLYPLAIALVDSECKSTWEWFLSLLFQDFGSVDETGWIFMSDRQKGLEIVFDQLMPGKEHRLCVQHMYKNFKALFKDKDIGNLFKAASYAGSKQAFEAYMNRMRSLPNGQEAANWLLRCDPSCWSRSHFSEGCNTDLVVNNVAESFNSWILDGRHLPVLSFLEYYRRKIMTRYHIQYEGMMQHSGRFGPKISKKLHNLKSKSRDWSSHPGGNLKFEVDNGYHTCVVDLRGRSCTCRIWNISGIPCVHACVAIHSNREVPEDYLHKCYNKETFIATYAPKLNPIPSRDEWPVSTQPDINPPTVKRPPRRPKKLRKRGSDEPPHPSKVSRVGLIKRCSKCKQEGHNSRSCGAALTGETHRHRSVRRQNSGTTAASTSVARSTSSES